MNVPSRKALVIGASTGIGRALAQKLSREGYALGVASRKVELLENLRRELRGICIVRAMDLRNSENALSVFRNLVEALGGVDLIVLNSGFKSDNPEFEWAPEKETLEVNVLGIAALAHEAACCFMRQGHGHLVGISSIAGVKGAPKVPAYSASKAFLSTYLEALYFRLLSRGIAVTDIRPGFVDTAMLSGTRVRFWVASPQEAADQIFQAIQKKRKVAYVTRRWALVALILKLIPDFVWAWANRKYRGTD